MSEIREIAFIEMLQKRTLIPIDSGYVNRIMLSAETEEEKERLFNLFILGQEARGKIKTIEQVIAKVAGNPSADGVCASIALGFLFGEASIPEDYRSLQDFGSFIKTKDKFLRKFPHIEEITPKDMGVFSKIVHQTNFIGGFSVEAGHYANHIRLFLPGFGRFTKLNDLTAKKLLFGTIHQDPVSFTEPDMVPINEVHSRLIIDSATQKEYIRLFINKNLS
jgi:hypothetical protein